MGGLLSGKTKMCNLQQLWNILPLTTFKEIITTTKKMHDFIILPRTLSRNVYTTCWLKIYKLNCSEKYSTNCSTELNSALKSGFQFRTPVSSSPSLRPLESQWQKLPCFVGFFLMKEKYTFNTHNS